MKVFIPALAVVLLSASAALALDVEFPQLPVSAYADTEVSTNLAFGFWTQREREFSFALSLNATPTNNVQVDFGIDVNADGALSAAESGLSAGWDCGSWVIQSGTNRAEAVSTAPGQKSLAFAMRLNRAGVPISLSVTEDGMEIFSGLSAALPEWLFSAEWNMMRLAARGAVAHGESFAIRYASAGTEIILK